MDSPGEKEYKQLHKLYRRGELDLRGKRKLLRFIQQTQESRLKLPEYKDRYRWLTIYDPDINFLLDMAEQALRPQKKAKAR